MRIQRLLLTTDLSPEGERPFSHVAELARQNGASVVLLHVVESVGVAAATAALPAPGVVPGTREELERTRALLAESVRKHFAGLKVEIEVLVAPSVPRAIVAQAERSRCDLIALSTHGRTGFRRLVLGSVAEEVLRQARVPVLVFPGKD